ncbi:hypothetical protein GO988_15435 [Hymenobacter sp. HMF4947]|uniref:Uncharacterized protein n=1 Tax=Hymenobacter ginkgonis TaxID=2682976 RepID=A0A7K1TH29_9BACT|nr:hypothetical protein [Hymenobacter ginkgonis]MVN77725.1 hypothetical protein [Hymenobacter ginkgonis]
MGIALLASGRAAGGNSERGRSTTSTPRRLSSWKAQASFVLTDADE